MQPYQAAAEETRKQGEFPIRAAKTAGSLAIGAGSAVLGGSVAGRVLPLLSKYIPENLAIQGLNKIDPRFGKFIKTALASGKNFEEVKDFIGQKAEESGEKKSKKPAKEERNIIQQYSPELHQFIDQEIKKGRTPIEAGALAYNNKKFMKQINKLKNAHKVNWSDIIAMVYGTGQTAQPQKSNQLQLTPEQEALRENVMNPPESQPTRPPSAEQQAATGQGQGLNPQLAQLLQEGIQAIKNYKRQP